MIERLTGWRALEWVGTVPPTVATTADTFGRERVDIVFGLDLRRPPIRSRLRSVGSWRDKRFEILALSGLA